MTTNAARAPGNIREPNGLAVRLQVDGQGLINVRLRGELDINTAPSTDNVSRLLSSMQPARVDLDLSGLSFLDIAGWRALNNVRAAVRAAGADFHVTARSTQVARLETLLTAPAAPAPSRAELAVPA